MDILNNREWAILIWGLTFLAYCLSNKGIRRSLLAVVKAFFAKWIIIIFSSMIIYVLIIVYTLYEIGLWQRSQLKTTLIWVVLVAAVSLFRINSITDDPHYFKKAAKDNFKLIIFIEYLVGFYTFTFLAEFLLAPVLFLLAGMKVIAEMDEQHAVVDKFLTRIFEVFGFFVLGYVIYHLVTGFNDFATLDTLADFYLPPLLSLTYLPFLYLVFVFTQYQTLFIRLRLGTEGEHLLGYAKRRAIFTFRFDVNLLKRWIDSIVISKIKNKDDIKRSITDLKKQIAYEKNPKEIPVEEGWCPYRAKDFLTKEGLITGYYKRAFDDDWFASSPLIKIGEGIMPNNIAYYVEGDKYVARRLKLKLNINEPERLNEAVKKLIDCSRILFCHAMQDDLPDLIEDSLQKCSGRSTTIGNKAISVKREDWPDKKLDNFELIFEIAVAN